MNKDMTDRCPNCAEMLYSPELIRCTCGHEIKDKRVRETGGLKTVYMLALVGGGLLAIWGLISTANHYGHEYMAVSIGRGGTSLALLAVTTAFAAILITKGFRLLALPLYCFSYVVVGSTIMYWIHAAAKGFAPDGPNELLGDYLMMAAFIVVAIVTSAVCMKIAGRTKKRES